MNKNFMKFRFFFSLGKIQLCYFIVPVKEHTLCYFDGRPSDILTELVYIFCWSWKGTSLSQKRFLWGNVECILNTHSFLYILYHCTLIIVHCICCHDVIYMWLSKMICSQSKWLWLWISLLGSFMMRVFMLLIFIQLVCCSIKDIYLMDIHKIK